MSALAMIQAVSNAIKPLTGGVTKELAGYLGDQIRFLRWKSAVHILKRAKKFCDDENIAPKKIPIKFIVPFLEAASFEDVTQSSAIPDMWASLFASAVTSYQARHALYIDILKKLSSQDALYIRKLHKKLMKEQIYRDDGFDPDMWNGSDKQDQIESFQEAFREQGRLIVDIYRRRGFVIRPNPFDARMQKCVSYSSRTDIIPLQFDLGLYQPEGWTNGTSSPFKNSIKDVDVIFNLVSLGLMEKFEVFSWYPRPHVPGDWAARATCSFAVLTSLGFDFMKTCSRDKVPRRQSRKKIIVASSPD